MLCFIQMAIAMEPADLGQVASKDKCKEKPLFNEIYIRREVTNQYNKYRASLLQARKDNDGQKIRKILDSCSYYAAAILENELFGDAPMVTDISSKVTTKTLSAKSILEHPDTQSASGQTFLRSAEFDGLCRHREGAQKRNHIEELVARLDSNYLFSDDKKLLSDLCKDFTQINGVDYDGYTPLHRTAMADSYNVMKLLLTNGANATVMRDKKSVIDYMPTCRFDFERKLLMLLAHGALLPSCQPHWNLLETCVEFGTYRPYIYDRDEPFEDIENFIRSTAANLFRALIFNDTNKFIKKLLLAKNDDINQKATADGKTLLHWAVCRNNEQAVKSLLARNNAKTIGLCIRSLLINGELPSPVNIDAQDESGYTPLMWAGHLGLRNIYNDLLLAGANPNLRDNRGLRATDHATKYGQIDSHLQLN